MEDSKREFIELANNYLSDNSKFSKEVGMIMVKKMMLDNIPDSFVLGLDSLKDSWVGMGMNRIAAENLVSCFKEVLPS